MGDDPGRGAGLLFPPLERGQVDGDILPWGRFLAERIKRARGRITS